MKRKYICPFNLEHTEQSAYSKTIPIPFLFISMISTMMCMLVVGRQAATYFIKSTKKIYLTPSQFEICAKTDGCCVLHPGNCKQSVPVALAIFHPSTSAAIKNYFP